MVQLLEGAGALRAAETLLRAAGGRVVKLRLPAPAASGDEGEQLGLATPAFEDVVLAPCGFRKAGARRELLVSGEAVARLVGSLAYDSAALLFAAAAGVLVDDELLLIEGMAPVESAGVAVCYRLTLRV